MLNSAANNKIYEIAVNIVIISSAPGAKTNVAIGEMHSGIFALIAANVIIDRNFEAVLSSPTRIFCIISSTAVARPKILRSFIFRITFDIKPTRFWIFSIQAFYRSLVSLKRKIDKTTLANTTISGAIAAMPIFLEKSYKAKPT